MWALFYTRDDGKHEYIAVAPYLGTILSAWDTLEENADEYKTVFYNNHMIKLDYLGIKRIPLWYDGFVNKGKMDRLF